MTSSPLGAPSDGGGSLPPGALRPTCCDIACAAVCRLFTACLIAVGDVEDAVFVDVEGHLDLRLVPAGLFDVGEIEGREQAIVGRHRAFALEDLDGDGRLVVLGGREDFLLRGRYGRVALDQL